MKIEKTWTPIMEFRYAAVYRDKSETHYNLHLQQKCIIKGRKPRWRTIRPTMMTGTAYLRSLVPEGDQVRQVERSEL